MRHLHEKMKVGSNAIGPLAQEAVTRVQNAVAQVPGLVRMTPSERLRTLKARTGSDRHIRAMARLAQERPELRPPGIDPTGMASRVDVVEQLAPLHAALSDALQQIEDTMLFAMGHAWADALDIYALAQSLARRTPELHDLLAPFEAFLRHGPHRPATPTTPLPPTAAARPA